MSKFGKILGLVAVLTVMAFGATMALAQMEEAADGPATFAPVFQDDVAPDEEGVAPEAAFHDGRGAPRGERGFLDRDAMKEVVADALGITVEELEAAHEDGTRLPDLAEALGVDIEDVEAAVEAARDEAIAQAVADGTITQEQADEIMARMELRQIVKDIWGKDAMKAATADALGITVEELEAAKEDGTRLPDLAETLGVDIEDVQAEVSAAREAAFAQAVADGLITQEQADEILSRPLRGKGHGGHGRHGGGQNGPGQNGGGAAGRFFPGLNNQGGADA